MYDLISETRLCYSLIAFPLVVKGELVQPGAASVPPMPLMRVIDLLHTPMSLFLLMYVRLLNRYPPTRHPPLYLGDRGVPR